MMNRKNILLILLAAGTVFTACKKEDLENGPSPVQLKESTWICGTMHENDTIEFHSAGEADFRGRFLHRWKYQANAQGGLFYKSSPEDDLTWQFSLNEDATEMSVNHLGDSAGMLTVNLTFVRVKGK